MALDKFDIPRKDWYDKDGRIYKDALIKNFNAIEEALNGLQNLSPFVVSETNWNEIAIPDRTLDSEDAGLINLKSFINIMGLDKFPAVCDVSGKTITKMVWYYNNARKSLTNKKLSISDGQFVWFTPATGNVSVISAATAASNISNNVAGWLLGGCYAGELKLVHPANIIDYDMLVPLSKMQIKPIVDWWQLNKNSQRRIRERVSGRTVAWTIINKRAGSMINLTYPDVGYEPDGQR